MAFSFLVGPVSSGGPDSPDGPGVFGYIILGGLGCAIVWALASERKRARQIRQYAERNGFRYIGAYLPTTFPFSETSVSWASSVSNAVEGYRGSKEVLFFDCRLGSGKGSKLQTVVAVRGGEECYGEAHFRSLLETENVDQWALIYRPQKRLPLEEIDSILSAI
jgi:hypothetical protein